MSKKITSQQSIKKFLDHPDRDSIISKMICDIPTQEIYEWLSALYDDNKSLVLSKASLNAFKDEYLDIYTTVRDDLLKTNLNQSIAQELQEEVQGNEDYKKKLAEIVDKELDIKTLIKNLVAKISFRSEQVFDLVQNDPRNTKMDKGLIDWMTLLLSTLEKFDVITNGSPDQINIQNNISIQLVDEHINVVYGIIREILVEMDYETSLLFTDLFTKRMAALKPDSPLVVPTEKRLEAAYTIEEQAKDKLGL